MNCGNIPRGETYVIRINKEDSRGRKICEEMMTKIYKLMQTINLCIHSLNVTSIRNMKKSAPKQIIIKYLKASDKEKKC